MKHKLFVLFGDDKCEILSTNKTDEFDKIRDDINIFEFQTLEELEAFKKGVDEAIGFNKYQLLSENDVEKVMESFVAV